MNRETYQQKRWNRKQKTWYTICEKYNRNCFCKCGKPWKPLEIIISWFPSSISFFFLIVLCFLFYLFGCFMFFSVVVVFCHFLLVRSLIHFAFLCFPLFLFLSYVCRCMFPVFCFYVSDFPLPSTIFKNTPSWKSTLFKNMLFDRAVSKDHF